MIQEGMFVQIRTYQPGDEIHQAATYNEAAKDLPNFKPATIQEIHRRTCAKDFDPTMRFYSWEGDEVLGYCLFNANGRVSYPWCRKGHERLQDQLFQKVTDAMTQRGYKKAFAAYRKDWPKVGEYFEHNGFRKAREMINFIQDLIEMPTVPDKPSGVITGLKRSDVPAIFDLCSQVFRVDSPAALEEYFFHNLYFGPDSVFVLRGKKTDELMGVGVLILEPTYANPKQLDPLMPCFRLGAFGTETMQTKRINGLWSLLARPNQYLPIRALELLGEASVRVQEHDGVVSLAAQAPSDVEHLVAFYRSYFTEQGSFPVYEKMLR